MIYAQGMALSASNTSPTLKNLVTCRNGHSNGSGDAGTAHRGADGEFIPRRTDGVSGIIC